jgi:hypothetical protein
VFAQNKRLDQLKDRNREKKSRLRLLFIVGCSVLDTRGFGSINIQ